MKETKTSFSPDRPLDCSNKEMDDERLNPTKAVEPLPETERPRKDGPGGE